MVNNYLAFLDEEIPTEGRGHNRALNISVKCLNHLLTRVLVDNGSSLNVMPKATLKRFPYEKTHLRDSSSIVRAFDGSRREVMGEIEIPLQIGPFTFQISFQVMDIRPTNSCPLGRPLIHSVGTVPSSFHQRIKFIVDDKLVIIYGEEDMLVSCPKLVGYIEAAEEALETAFQSLEIISTTYVEGKPEEEKGINSMTKAARIMIRKGFRVGRGLGRNLDGISRPISHLIRHGLGYRPKANSTRSPRHYHRGNTTLYERFISKGYANQVEEASTKEECGPENFVRPCSSQEELSNWTMQEVFGTLTINFILISYFRFKKMRWDKEPPSELKRLVESEDKIICPYQEEIETINIGTEENEKKIRVGTAVCLDTKSKLIHLLIEYVNIFAWSYQDMPRLNNEIVEHKIPIKAKYPLPNTLNGVANIVPVPKQDGKVKICKDYRDLNRASPKEDFPLPHIDILVDNTAQQVCFSFMDEFSGYNQIKMAPKDMENFHHIVGNILLQGYGGPIPQHDAQRSGLFERLRKYWLCLNLAKYTFGVKLRKLLGFIVSERGIEVDPDKVRAIQEIPIFRLLRKSQKVEWNEDCQKSEPLILVPLVARRPLILYLTVLEKSMGPAKALRSSRGPRPTPSRPGPISSNSPDSSPMRGGPITSSTSAIQRKGHLSTSMEAISLLE
ncbi:hypothetical protein CR513_03587, partial [Mucuna pruriens]